MPNPASTSVRGRAILHTGSVNIENEEVTYTLRRVPRRRHVHLVVDDDAELEVRAPYRFRPNDAELVIRAHSVWVIRMIKRAREAVRAKPMLETGFEMPLLDERLQLHVSSNAQASVTRGPCTLWLKSPTMMRSALRSLLEEWYRHQARCYLPSRLMHFANQFGFAVAKVSVRGQKTQWGSCSGRGAISVNWRLMLMPSDVVDYVLIHELCHLRHSNHSPEFWALVAVYVPDFRERQRRLKALQAQLPI